MSERLPRVTAAALRRAQARDGWFVTREGRRHTILGHPAKPGIVPVPRHAGAVLKPGTLTDILDQAGLTPEQFRDLL